MSGKVDVDHGTVWWDRAEFDGGATGWSHPSAWSSSWVRSILRLRGQITTRAVYRALRRRRPRGDWYLLLSWPGDCRPCLWDLTDMDAWWAEYTATLPTAVLDAIHVLDRECKTLNHPCGDGHVGWELRTRGGGVRSDRLRHASRLAAVLREARRAGVDLRVEVTL